MDFKFRNISESDILRSGKPNFLLKAFSAKVYSVEESTKHNGQKYCKFLLKQGTSKIVALAFGDTSELMKKFLKPSKKKTVTFQPRTFSCKLKNKTYESQSSCKYDLTFHNYSEFIWEAKSILKTSQAGNTVSESCSLKEVLSALAKTSEPISKKLKSVRFNGGKIYRYLGCEKCHSSIPRTHTDGKYYCNGKTCNSKNARKSRIGVTSQRKICFTIYDLEISDDSDETIASVVIYNRMCEKILQKNGSDFNVDETVVKTWQELIARSRFDITLKRGKKTKGSHHIPELIVNEVDNVIQQDAAIEMADAGIVYEGPWPDFPEYEMKLQQTAAPYKDWAKKYPINSKPPGLVLLINNYNFPHSQNEEDRERRGSEIDINALYRGFAEMGYKIFRGECQMDVKTRMEFENLIADFKEQLLECEVDSIFIIISSHGVNHGIKLSEGECINVVEELMIPFSDENFPEYQGKPKVFMPIGCQNLGGLDYRPSPDDQANLLFDMLVCFPALPGYAQNRVCNKGTLFVHLLMLNLMDYAVSWDFVQILNKVQDDMKQQIISNELTMWTVSHHYSIVFRPFYLIPRT